MLGSIKGPDSSDTRSSLSSASKLLVVLSDCRTRSAINGDGSNKFADVAADADVDTDDGSNEFTSDADVDNKDKDTGANADDDNEDDEDKDNDTAVIRANDPCKLVLTVIGDLTSCRSVITDDAVKDNVPNDDKVAAAAASSILFVVHAFAFRPRCCAIADAVFFPFFEFKI